MTSTTREVRPAADDDRGWMNEVLHEAPRLRPLRRWATERPAFIFFAAFQPLLMVGLLRASSSPLLGLRAVMSIMIAVLGAVGLIELVRWVDRRSRADACKRSPCETWLHDRSWNERGESRSWVVRIAGALDPHAQPWRVMTVLLAALGILFLSGSHWWIGALMIGSAASWLFLVAWRIHGAGDAHLSYAQFPFHTGERVTLFFGMSTGGAHFRDVRFRLFHVSEFRGGTLGLQRGVRISRAMHDRRPPGTLPGPDFDVEVSFDVPADAPGTRLTDDLPAYWVLEVRGVTTAGRYVERFLVPIYERPAPPVDEPPPA